MEHNRPTGNMDNFNICMNREVKQELDSVASNFGYSRSQVVELAVINFITDKEKMADGIKQEAMKKLKVLKKMKVKGKEDINPPKKERKRE
jgi:metal-responsive CopG/Arc/MetJ family transcriptional regulator